MIFGFATLLLCQLAGEIVARTFGLPVPGPVLGLLFLTIGLAIAHRRRALADEWLDQTGVATVSDGLLRNLSLLFVPAGVGVIDQLDILKSQALALGTAIVVSTILTLAVTVLVFTGVKRLFVGPEETAP